MASEWCGGMLRMPVTALTISSCTAHHHLSISLHRAEQSESGDPPFISLQIGVQVLSALMHSLQRGQRCSRVPLWLWPGQPSPQQRPGSPGPLRWPQHYLPPPAGQLNERGTALISSWLLGWARDLLELFQWTHSCYIPLPTRIEGREEKRLITWARSLSLSCLCRLVLPKACTSLRTQRSLSAILAGSLGHEHALH